MKFWKWVAIAAGLVILLFAAVMVVFFMMLPSPADVGRKIYQTPAPPRAVPPATATAANPPVPGENAAPPAPPAVTEAGTETPSRADGNLSMKNDRDRRILRKLMDPAEPMTKFCDHLGTPSTASGKVGRREFGEKMIAHFTDATVSDPAMEAAVPVLKQVFLYPEMREILSTAERAAETGDSSFVGKAQFYGMIYSAYRRLAAERPKLEKISDRSYHFFMMARALDRRPELRNDRAVMDYCRQIERATNTHAPFGEDEERRGFREFLDQVRVRPEEIGYDPDYRTRLDVKMGGGSLTFNGGWLDQWLQPEPAAVNR